MSTEQPPGGPAAGGYPQPQDPWAGAYEPGVASVPTDPIPQQYEPYAGPGGVWSQPTVLHDGYAPGQSRGVAKVIGLGVVVLLVAGGAGYGAYLYTTKPSTPHAGQTTTPPVNPTTTSPSPPETTSPPAHAPFDPHDAKNGDCIFNYGTNDDPDLGQVSCSTPQSYTIIKIATGAGIPEGPNNSFDRDTTSVAVCSGTGYQTWYGYKDPTSPDRDVFFCMTNN